MSTAITAIQATLVALRDGTTLPAAVSFTELQKIVGFPAYWEREAKYGTKE